MTGYFTYLHFVNLNIGSLRDKAAEVFKYTKRKFSKFLPYTFIAVLSSLAVRHVIILKDFQIKMIPKAVLESLMLIRGDSNVGVLWYLCAILWVFPLFCFSCMIFQRKTMLILSSIGSVIFYGFVRSYAVYAPRMFARAFVGLLLGVIIYELSCKLNSLNINSGLTGFLTILLLAIPIVLNAINIECTIPIIICFVLGFAFTFSKSDIPTFWSKSIWTYLEKWSFSLYLVYLNVEDLVCWISKVLDPLKSHEQYIIYTVLTAVGVIVLEISVEILNSTILAKRQLYSIYN